MARRQGKAWINGLGWVSKKPTQERDYTGYERAADAFLLWTFRWFPDKLLDLVRGPEADFEGLELMQRVMLRAYARKQRVSFTGCRGMTKTYTKFLSKMVDGLVWPGCQSSYYGPSYKQMAAIADKTYHQIAHDYPLLASWWRVTAQSKEDFKIETDTGGAFYIAAMRGDNITDVTAEEYAQEENPPFDYTEYKRVVLPAVRLWHNVGGVPDENFVGYKKHAITSAGRKQNHAFQTRCKTMKAMTLGESAFAMDISWETVVLQLMRPYQWAADLKEELTAEEWMREMESRYTGADEFPMLTDETLMDSQRLMVMERQHCCKDKNCPLKPEDVIYILGYDVSYENSAKNAKCAVSVLKLTQQEDFLKRTFYLKQEVYLDDWPPPDNQMVQARKLKDVWHRFCYEGSQTYISIDDWQYGKGVVECLMMDVGDGLPPLCIYNHAAYSSAELPGALPVIYPIKTGGTGVTDPDFEMIKYAQTQFENHNVELLTGNQREGLEAYKARHNIKSDEQDWYIVRPYQKARELVGQIQNLKLVPSGAGMSEKRISKSIQRDSWSALKYALRFAQKLEKRYLMTTKKKSDWSELLAKYEKESADARPGAGPRGRTVGSRRGGRMF